MPRPERTERANADLVEIWMYIARRNESAADRLIDTIDSKCQILAETPGAGTLRPELGPTVRSFPVGNYVIFFEAIEVGVRVLRVLHGARDIETAFFED